MSAASSEHPATGSPSHRRALPRLPPGAAWPIVAIALIWAALLLHVHERRTDALDAARANVVAMAGAYEEGLARGLGAIEQTLLYVRALHARDGATLDLTPWVNSAELASRAVVRILLTDRNGAATLIDLHRPAAPTDLSDQPFFRFFAVGQIDDRLFISAPVQDKAANSGRWSVEFARALITPQGKFDGVVLVAVDADSLVRGSLASETGHRGTVTLDGLDGIVRARAGDADGPSIGQRSASPAIARAAAEAGGEFDWSADGERRIGDFRRIPGYPLVVEATQPADEALQAWRASLITTLLTGLALSGTIAAAGAIAARRVLGAAESQQMIVAALHYIDQGLILLDPHGRIAMMNRRAVALLDIPERFVPGVHFGTLLEWQRREGEFRFGEPPTLAARFEAARAEPTVQQAYFRTRPNGTVLEVHTQPLPGGWLLCVYGDVTATKQVAAALLATRDAMAAMPAGTPPDAAPPAPEPAGTRPVPMPGDGGIGMGHLAIEHLTEILGDDAVAGIVASFADELPRQLARMAELAQTRETDPLMREAHALAVSAATIGLDELGAAASELEDDLKWRRPDYIPARLDRIDRMARAALDRLSAYLHKSAA